MKRSLISFLTIVMLTLQATTIPQWYYEIKDIKVQKEAFFKILKPLVDQENQKILNERAFVEEFFKKFSQNPFVEDRLLVRLAKIATKYRIKNFFNKEEYLRKIDAIPISLVLAQAALESGWGKSRFAKEANNLFGEWTWGKRGLVPKNRDENKTHKIKIFNTIEESIASYMLNLNRHKAYKEFRLARWRAKKGGVKFDGLQAAFTMRHYSELGERYNRLLTTVIKKNNLHHYY